MKSHQKSKTPQTHMGNITIKMPMIADNSYYYIRFCFFISQPTYLLFLYIVTGKHLLRTKNDDIIYRKLPSHDSLTNVHCNHSKRKVNII